MQHFRVFKRGSQQLNISVHSIFLCNLHKKSTLFFDDISEWHPTPSWVVERSDDRGSENAGSADAEGDRPPARPLRLVLLKAGVREHQPNLALAHITALERRQTLRNGDTEWPVRKTLHDKSGANRYLCFKIIKIIHWTRTTHTCPKVDSSGTLKPVSAAVWMCIKVKNLFSAVISSWSKFKGLASQWLKKCWAWCR